MTTATVVVAGVLLAAACGGETLPLQGADDGPATGGGAGASATTGGASGRNSGSGGSKGGTAGQGEEGGAFGDSGTGGTAITGPEPTAVDLSGGPVYTRVQRLTLSQWRRSVADILRLEAPVAEFQSLELRGSPGSFTNNEKFLLVETQLAAELEQAAEAAAAAATASPEALSRVYADSDPAGFVRTLGRRAFRRPLTTEEETRYGDAFTLGETLYGAGFANGAALVIRAMLQSPHFLYRSELGPGGEPLAGHEVASKLSFWLRGTTPSDALLDAALAGQLDTVEGLEAMARQMLDEPTAVEVMRDFHSQLYGLEGFRSVEKPGVPEFTEASKAELEQASNAFFDRVFTEGAGLREILTSTRAFVGPGLASFYGIAAPAGLEERTLDASRAGFFMQVPFLLEQGQLQEPLTIARGLSLAMRVLCVLPQPPPPSTPPLPDVAPGQTNRQRIEANTSACGFACHGTIEPLGFALEAFDGLGQWRAEDNGLPVDTAASYPFSDGNRSFSDGTELMHIMADGRQAHTCYAKELSSYALQRDIIADDVPLLDELEAVSKDAESLKEMAVALVRDPAFRLRKEVAP